MGPTTLPGLRGLCEGCLGFQQDSTACPKHPGQSCDRAGHSGPGMPFIHFLLLCLFCYEEGARSWAVETGLAPDKGRKASRGEIGAWELSVAGEISEARCEGNDLYLSPEIQ